MNEVLLSVIVPAYNAENFIETAIESFLNQNADWAEMIVVDDGSIYGTFSKCEPYFAQGIKYFKTENSGAGHARNYGMSMATGRWIEFLDSDDLISNQAFSKLYEIIESDNNYDIIYCSAERSNMEMTDISTVEAEDFECIQNNMPKLWFCSSLYRKSFLVQNKVRFFEYREQDVETAFRFMAFSRAKNIKVCKDITLFMRRENPYSNINTWNLMRVKRIKALVYLQLIEEYDNQDASVFDYLYETYTRCFIDFLTILWKNGEKESQKFKQDIIRLSKGLSFDKFKYLVNNYNKMGVLAMLLSCSIFADLFLKICNLRKDKKTSEK